MAPCVELDEAVGEEGVGGEAGGEDASVGGSAVEVGPVGDAAMEEVSEVGKSCMVHAVSSPSAKPTPSSYIYGFH